MKNTVLFYLIISLGLIIVFASCATVGSLSRDTREIESNVSVGDNESLIVIKRNKNFTGSASQIAIFVNEEFVAFVPNGGITSFVIPNGEHSIVAALWTGTRNIPEFTASGLTKTSALRFTANSNRITFGAGMEGWFFLIFKTQTIKILRIGEERLLQ